MHFVGLKTFVNEQGKAVRQHDKTMLLVEPFVNSGQEQNARLGCRSSARKVRLRLQLIKTFPRGSVPSSTAAVCSSLWLLGLAKPHVGTTPALPAQPCGRWPALCYEQHRVFPSCSACLPFSGVVLQDSSFPARWV